MLLLHLISWICVFFLVFPFMITLLGFLRRERRGRRDSGGVNPDFAIVITAYRNWEITLPGVQSLLDQQTDLPFHVYLVADGSEPIDYPIKSPQVSVFFPEPNLNLKVKSIIYALEQQVRAHTHVIIFDADNLAHPQFLSHINNWLQKGFDIVQGRRVAKNLDGMYACADATGEYYKNWVDRYALFKAGSSAVISGSGMVVDMALYLAYLQSPEIEKGKHKWKKMLQEDKILQNFLLRKNYYIAYAWKALIYDEKVASAAEVTKQRSRWLYSYFQNIPNSLDLFWRGIQKLSVNQVLFACTTISPPLFLLVGISLICLMLQFLFQGYMILGLLAGLVVFIFHFLWSLYLSNAPRKIWQNIWGIPFFIWNQFRGLFRMHNPNKNFGHTEHQNKVQVKDLLDKKK